MKQVSITREDIKANSYNILLTIAYGIIIAVIYAYWAYVECHRIWVSFIIVLGVGLIAYFVGFMWTKGVANKRVKTLENTENKEEEKNQEN